MLMVFPFISALGLFSPHAAADETVARQIEPWWESASPAARSVERLRTIAPESWSPAEREERTFVVPAVEGKSDEARLLAYDLFATADVFHYPEDQSKFQGGMQVVYEVVQPADIMLRCNSGSALWRSENTSNGKLTVFYTGGTWDLTGEGVFALNMPIISWRSYTGAPFAKGAYVVDSLGMQVYRAESGEHVKVMRPHDLGGVIGPDAWFTVADLSEYEIAITEVATDWEKSGYVGAVVTLTDADGESFDLPGAEVTAIVSGEGEHESCVVPLEPTGGIYEKGSVNYRFKFFGAYPPEFYDKQQITVKATVWVLGPDGVTREEQVQRVVTRDQAKPVPLAVWQNRQRREDIRTADGRLMESRFLWAHGQYFKWWQSLEKADAALQATSMIGANIFGGGIYFNGRAHVRTDKMITLESIWEGPDVFAYLIEQAHAAGIEVHPAVNCAGGGGGYGGPQLLVEHPEWAVENLSGERSARIVDMHRPEFRRHFIEFIADVAARYDVDGIKLDFTRIQERCYCEQCREEYRQLTGRDLVEDAKPPYTEDYIRWQEDAVADLVRGIREALDAVRPGLKLSHWGHDEPGSPSFQGRRPDVWLNNGWIDWFEIGCYGGDPDAAVRTWSRIARMVDRPECVWPAFAFYIRSIPQPGTATDTYVPIPRNNEFTGDGFHAKEGAMGCRRPVVLTPMYEAFRDTCGLSGLALFDLCQQTKETAEAYGRELFVEPAVPWYPQHAPD